MKKEKQTQSSKTTNKGFTLIELLVVVLIIGILAAIALPQYKFAVLKTKFATIKNVTKSIAEARERYYLIHNEYPMDLDKIDIDFRYIRKDCPYECYYYLDDKTNIVVNDDQTYVMWVPNDIGKIVFGYFHTDKKFRCIPYAESGIMNKLCQDELGKPVGYWGGDY